MEELTTAHYPQLSEALIRHGFDYWYGSPELWCCQDYKVLFDGVRLLNEDGCLLIPPMNRKNMTSILNLHLREIGFCDILFAPHYIEQYIHPLVFKQFKVEQVDNNYINDTQLVLELKGNKLKKLRNNVNNFKEVLRCKDLTHADLPQAIRLCEKYHNQSEEFDDVAYNTRILENLRAFNLIRRGYWLGEELVAFNIGAPLSSTSVSFIISKSRHDIKYLVDFVRHDFHRLCYELGYKTVNDGSDLNSEGLTRLKKKFAPVAIQPVYSMEWID